MRSGLKSRRKALATNSHADSMWVRGHRATRTGLKGMRRARRCGAGRFEEEVEVEWEEEEEEEEESKMFRAAAG
jgi:hypothetical protein